MKLKLIKTAAALLVAATFLAGCKFEGTKASFNEDNKTGYNAVLDSGSGNVNVPKAGVITLFNTSNFGIANDKSEIVVYIISQGKLEEKSIDAALNVYTLTDATDDNYAVGRSSALPKTLRKIDVVECVNGISAVYSPIGEWCDNEFCVVTQVYYYVNTSTVTKEAVAFYADATKLKEKTGQLILNGNGNEKCGEESDSFIDYVSVAKKADKTTDTDSLKGIGEDVCPTFNLNCSSTPSEFELADGKQTGVLIYRVAAPSKTNSSTTIYADTFAADLSKMYSIRTLAIGDKKWTETPLSFTYDSENHRYEAKTAALAYGTKYVLVTKENNSLEWTAAKDWYGHVPRLGYTKNRKNYSSARTYNYFKDSPAYILNTPNNDDSTTEATFGSNNYGQGAFDTTQRALLSVSKRTNAFLITIDTSNKIRFGSYDGFVVTDDKLTTIKTKKPVVYAEDETGVYSVLVELENKNLDISSFKVWVGEATTIKGNKAYPTQLKFGAPAVEDTSLLTGYVQIYNY